MPQLDSIYAQFSKNRLNDEPLPDDVKILLAHKDELSERIAIELNWEDGWAPWLDTSYLSEADLANPDIAANVRAIHEVCGHIAFIAMDEESQYYGYWRGPQNRPIAACRLVFLDNEGQFRMCSGSTFTEAVRATDHYGQKDGFRVWILSLGISLPDDIPDTNSLPKDGLTPDQLHQELYRRYLEQMKNRL